MKNNDVVYQFQAHIHEERGLVDAITHPFLKKSLPQESIKKKLKIYKK
jgi:hypothetical protein